MRLLLDRCQGEPSNLCTSSFRIAPRTFGARQCQPYAGEGTRCIYQFKAFTRRPQMLYGAVCFLLA